MTNIDDYLKYGIELDISYERGSSRIKSLNPDYEGIVRLHGEMMKLNKIEIEKRHGKDYYDAIAWVLDEKNDAVGSLRMACDLLGKNYEVACEDYLMMDPNGDFRCR